MEANEETHPGAARNTFAALRPFFNLCDERDGKEHPVHLSPQVMNILYGLPTISSFVIATNGEAPISLANQKPRRSSTS